VDGRTKLDQKITDLYATSIDYDKNDCVFLGSWFGVPAKGSA